MDINIDESIIKWEKDVIDTSKNNRLLYFNSESFLKISMPSMLFLFDDLVNKDKKMGVHLSGEEENRKKDEIVFSKKDGISKALGNMFYQANSSLKEHGSNALFISFGLLKWSDENGKTVETQLFFVPVTLSRKMYDNFTIESMEGDIFFNPVLKEKLEQFGIKFDFNFEDNLNLAEAIRNFKLTVKDTKWIVNRNSYMGIISFTNNTIYNDIKGNHEAIKKNELTRALAGDFEIIKQLNDKMPDDVDYSINTVMDADSSQTKAIYSARSGGNFILNGPPGTGKSQTIANIIADFLKNNKTVLFVSEKNAAIEVVKKRLEDSGLGDFILNFHGNTPKSEIIKSLYKSVENNGHVPRTLAPTDRYSEVLNSYVRAVHLKRGKLARSIYEACLIELENKNSIDVKIKQSLLDTTREELDSLEFQISEFNDYLDIIENYKLIPDNFKIDRYREDPEIYYRGIDMIRDSLDSIDELIPAIKEKTELDIVSVEDLDRIYRFLSIIDPEIKLEEKYLDPEFIGEAYALLDSREKTLQELDYMMDIFLKKRKKQFLHRDMKSLKRQMLEDYSSALKRLSGDYKKLLKDIMEVTVDQSRKHYNEIMDDIEYALKIQEKHADLLRIESDISAKNIDPENVSAKIRYAKKIISIFPENHMTDGLSRIISGTSNPQDLMDIKTVHESLMEGINYLADILPSYKGLTGSTFSSIRETIETASSFDIDRYVKFRELYDGLKSAGVDISPALNCEIHMDSILHAFRNRFNHEFINHYVRDDPDLRNFRSSSHERIIGMFIDFDRKRIEINRANLISELTERRGEILSKYPGPSMIIKTEHAKKKFQKPLKILFGELKDVMGGLKPCIMMSPNNVSAYLDKGFLFDLLIFDEASQLTPPDAVGSLIRAKQVIISGDTQQLPPTSFFENINVSKYEDDYVVLDNILDQFDAIGLSKIFLKWHYRSVDDRLIAFSNKYFYENSLETFPSAYKKSNDSGIQFVHIDGTYSRGKSKTNKAEANEVVRLIKEELLNTNSIGVVTLSEAQRSAVEETLNSYSRHDTVLADLINTDGIFVKNLENVQGDEKDVIILSTGYGRDENGRITMNFGPINTAGGEKRLNVAITRARKKFIVVSSMDPEDIRVPEKSGRGPELLKLYMIYAKNQGNDSYLQKFGNDDAIINDIASKVEAEGFRTVKNVGYSMNNIPLAIIDPDNPDHYIMGIETDGRIYYSMKTASERDRIRKTILSERGWNLYRIWSLDYMKNPDKVLHEILNAVSRFQKSATSSKSIDSPTGPF
jgi:tetratricopeptide (TPR) repeat protein